MTADEFTMLVTLINDAGLNNGKVIKADGLWHVLGATKPEKPGVPLPINNMASAQWGTEYAVVVEARR